MTARDRKLTRPTAQRIADFLRESPKRSLEQAALANGVQPSTLRMALKRFRDGESGPEERAAMWDVALAVEEQCEALLTVGDGLSTDGKTTLWQQWRLETKHRTSYGRVTSHKVSGEEGAQPIRIEVEKMSEGELRSELERLDRELGSK